LQIAYRTGGKVDLTWLNLDERANHQAFVRAVDAALGAKAAAPSVATGAVRKGSKA